jgi:hypothetical protein
MDVRRDETCAEQPLRERAYGMIFPTVTAL